MHILKKPERALSKSQKLRTHVVSQLLFLEHRRNLSFKKRIFKINNNVAMWSKLEVPVSVKYTKKWFPNGKQVKFQNNKGDTIEVDNSANIINPTQPKKLLYLKNSKHNNDAALLFRKKGIWGSLYQEFSNLLQRSVKNNSPKTLTKILWTYS